jgi:thiamine biosynthesis lipoprotein
MRRVLGLLVILCLSACLPKDERDVLRLSGQTMGTYYNIVAIGTELDAERLTARIETVLDNVDSSMSNWNPASEISRFSASRDTTPQDISQELAHVMQGAARVHAQSEGMFDVTLGPLIELWGFGTRKTDDPQPSEAAIANALRRVGQARLLTLDHDGATLAKARPEVEVNLAAIAKGYGIDALAQALRDEGLEDFMVEIGGDLVTSGHNERDQPWRIGIETPDPGNQRNVQRVIGLSGLGMASSGDYRNFFERDGRRYSHLLDPTTGRPVTHTTTSATVLAENAMMADAWATAMLVLGRERGMAVAERHGVAVFFISRDRQRDGQSYILDESSAFSALTTTD